MKYPSSICDKKVYVCCTCSSFQTWLLGILSCKTSANYKMYNWSSTVPQFLKGEHTHKPRTPQKEKKQKEIALIS